MPFLTIVEANARQRAARLEQAALALPHPQARFDGALQVRIQTTFSRFWQERLLSLVEPDAPLARHLLLSPHFFLQSSWHIEHEALPPTDPARLDSALQLFDLPMALLERKLSRLSNGELRRLLLARAYMENPATLVLDDPLGGLDPAHREGLERALTAISEQGITVLWGHPGEAEREMPHVRGMERLAPASQAFSSEILVQLEKISVRFDDSLILENLDWRIHAGEHWVLSGPNGSGKSTLLAFLTADHPQMYRNRVELLGKRPGQGLSVWEHKRHCGFSSPEQHHQWRGNASLLETVASGFLDPREPDGEILAEDQRVALHVALQLGLPIRTEFQKAAYVHQRLALVARALIKHPQLLILDEPDQGLGETERVHLFQFLDSWLAESCSTLILATHHASHLPSVITHRLNL